MGERLLVLGWHNIDPTPGFPDPEGAGRRGFARQLAALARWTNVLPLATALDLVEQGRPLPPRAVVLTFDDGYRDNLELGVPMLARHALPASFFLVPGFLSGTATAWWEDLARAFDTADPVRGGELTWRGERLRWGTAAERGAAQAHVRSTVKTLDHATRVEAVAEIAARVAPGAPEPAAAHRGLFLDWDGAQALLAAGHAVGSHTCRHAILEREDPDTQATELIDSRAELEHRLGVGVDTLAYPNGAAGDYSDVTTAVAARAGYRAALTTRPGLAFSAPRYEVRRVIVTPTTDLRAVAGKGWRKARALVRRVTG